MITDDEFGTTCICGCSFRITNLDDLEHGECLSCGREWNLPEPENENV